MAQGRQRLHLEHGRFAQLVSRAQAELLHDVHFVSLHGFVTHEKMFRNLRGLVAVTHIPKYLSFTPAKRLIENDRTNWRFLLK